MKKAEKIYQNNYSLGKDEEGNEVFYKWQVLAAIKEAQEDAIRETVIHCSEAAKVTYNDYDDLLNGKETYIVDKQSILSVEDKLIKDL